MEQKFFRELGNSGIRSLANYEGRLYRDFFSSIFFFVCVHFIKQIKGKEKDKMELIKLHYTRHH